MPEVPSAKLASYSHRRPCSCKISCFRALVALRRTLSMVQNLGSQHRFPCGLAVPHLAPAPQLFGVEALGLSITLCQAKYSKLHSRPPSLWPPAGRRCGPARGSRRAAGRLRSIRHPRRRLSINVQVLYRYDFGRAQLLRQWPSSRPIGRQLPCVCPSKVCNGTVAWNGTLGTEGPPSRCYWRGARWGSGKGSHLLKCCRCGCPKASSLQRMTASTVSYDPKRAGGLRSAAMSMAASSSPSRSISRPA